MDFYKILRTVVIIITFTFGMFSITSSLQIGHKTIGGIYMEELPPPIYYDTFLPIILEYSLPRWNKSEVTFNNWYNCTTESAPYRFSCPVTFHMNSAVLNLHIDFHSLQPVVDPLPSAAASEYRTLLTKSSRFCETIQKHFNGIYTSEYELDNYIQNLENCDKSFERDLIYLERSMQDFNYSIRYPYTKMESNYYNTFYKQIMEGNGSKIDLIASATLSNARTTIQGTLLSSFYAERYRWFHGMQDCNQGIIPHSLITQEKFTQVLETLSKRTQFNPNYQFSIPLDTMSKYYNLPISDCTFTNSSFVARIQIPVMKKLKATYLKLQFLRLIVAPFNYKNKICHVKIPRETYVWDQNRNLAYRTSCKSGELCSTFNLFSYHNYEPCATSLLANDFDGIRNNCDFECSSIAMSEGILTRVSTDRYLVTGNEVSVLNISCKAGERAGESPIVDSSASEKISTSSTQEEDTWEVHSQTTGSLEIQLPCNCKLIYGNQELYAENHCGTTTALTHITPYHLLEKSSDTKPTENLIEYFTNKGTKNKSKPFGPHTNTKSTTMNENNSEKDSSHTGIWILVILTTIINFVILLYILYETKFKKGGSTTMPKPYSIFRTRRRADSEPEVGLIST